MSWRSTVTAMVVVGAAAFAAGRGWSEDEKPKMPSKEEIEKMMAEIGAPVEQHKLLASTAGAWDGDVTMWMDPANPEKSKGTSTRRVIGNGLYVVEEFKGEFMGKPFEGFGVHGYSKDKKQYVGFWCDNLSTSPEFMWGTPDETGKVVTYDGGEMMCAMGPYTPRWVVKYEDADHSTFEHWSKSAMTGGEYVKEVEVKSTRRK